MKALEQYKQILETKGVVVDAGILKNEAHYFAKLYIAHKLEEVQCEKEAYEILRYLYEKSAVRFDKELFASYEDYVEEKVKYFVSLANLSYKVTGEPAKSLPYLDEALIAIEGEESAYPYIDRAEIKKLRDYYRSLVG